LSKLKCIKVKLKSRVFSEGSKEEEPLKSKDLNTGMDGRKGCLEKKLQENRQGSVRWTQQECQFKNSEFIGQTVEI
jgi:hypothetical protein